MLHQKRIFSGKMTKSYKTIFGPTFSAIFENLLEPFFAMSQKLRFWPNMAIFSHVKPNLGKIRIFLKKRALLSFYPYCPLTSCQVSEKSLEWFPRSIALRTDVWTYGRTYGQGWYYRTDRFAGSIIVRIDLEKFLWAMKFVKVGYWV